MAEEFAAHADSIRQMEDQVNTYNAAGKREAAARLQEQIELLQVKYNTIHITIRNIYFFIFLFVNFRNVLTKYKIVSINFVEIKVEILEQILNRDLKKQNVNYEQSMKIVVFWNWLVMIRKASRANCGTAWWVYYLDSWIKDVHCRG